MADPVGTVKIGSKAIGQAEQNVIARLKKCFQDGPRSGDPESCSLQDVAQTVSEIKDTNFEAVKDIMKRALTDAGVAREDAEHWLGSHAKEIWDNAEKIRHAAPVVDHSLKYLKYLFTAAAVAAMAMATGLVHPRPGHPFIPSGANGVITGSVPGTGNLPAEPELTVPSLEEVQLVLAAPPPAAAAFPPPVAAMAAQPLAVDVEDPNTGETRAIDTTIGTAYNHIPATRVAIRNEARYQEQESEAAATNTPPPPEHHFLDANPDNTLRSGEVNPAWKFPNKLTTGQINKRGSFDGNGHDLHDK